MNKFKISHLKAKKKADIYALCLAEFGNDTATTYRHYTKAEMIDDLMTVKVATAPSETAEATTQVQLPFIGFYESYHTAQPHEIMEAEIGNYGELITDEQSDNILDIFHSEFAYNVYHQKIAELYAHWLIHRLDPNAVFTAIELHSPKEYNFTTDTITVTLAVPIPNLTLDYFTENGLMYETLAVIKERYTSRDGFISFVNPTPPTPYSVFIEPAYLDCALEVLVYHTLEMDYTNTSYSHLEADLDTAFTDYMVEGNRYDELVWEFMPEDLVQFF